MSEYTVLISIILITIILLYTIYKNLKKYKDAFSVKDVKKAIDKVGDLGKEIENLGNKLGNEISKVESLGNELGKLGNEIENISKYPAEMSEIIGREIKKVADQADKKITSSFNKAFDEIEDTANDAFNEIEGAANEVGNFATNAIDEIYKVLKKMGDEIAKIPQQVADLANKIFLDYIPKLFEAGWKGFEKYIIGPITNIFGELINVFQLIGDVFREIIKVLMRIPSCVPVYFFDISYEITMSVLKTVLPGWLKDIFRTIYNYVINPIIIPIFNFILGLIKTILEFIGFNFNLEYYSEFRKKCYDFGPLNLIFETFLEIFQLFMKAFSLLFKLIPFDKIINEILELFGGGKKNKNKEPEEIPDYQLIKVGKSKENETSITMNLPKGIMYVSNIPYNSDGTMIINTYPFKVTTNVDNNNFTISRSDENSGWDIDVYFRGYTSQFNQVIDSSTQAFTDTVENVQNTLNNTTQNIDNISTSAQQQLSNAAQTTQNKLDDITNNLSSFFSNE